MAENGDRPAARRNRRVQWVFDILSRSGTERTSGDKGVYAFDLTEPLASTLGRKTLRFTFQRRLGSREGVELAAHGSWLHDQLLKFAGGWGRTTAFYLPRPGEVDRESLLAKRRIGGSLEERLEERYGTLLQFTVRLSYYTDPPRESLLTLVYDTTQGKVLKRGCSKRLLETGREAPEDGLAVSRSIGVREGFAAVWSRIENTVEEEVHRLRQEGREALAGKLRTLENYYRQLIEEEKRTQKSRTSRRSREESEAKLDLFKLEWERRVSEETARLEPQVVASLAAVARIHSPCERWRLGGDGEGQVWLDLTRGEAWRVRKTPTTGQRCSSPPNPG
jgi:AAA+ ATPase superfamily predicted ATPase